MFLCYILSCLLFCQALAYPNYKNKIPNGSSVPGPSGSVWPGVGHLSAYGSGPRNQFGMNFAECNYEWTQTLCEKDSDGDGKTNGVELGDPMCTWKVGETPDSPATSHPGIKD